MEKIFTERAHLMCPHMNFGIAMSVDSAFDGGRIGAVLESLADVHPFLRAVLGHDGKDNSYFYNVTDSSKTTIMVSEDILTGMDDPALIREYEILTGYDWDIRKEGLLKVTAWNMQGRTAILLVFHHLLADGRGALGLAEEIADELSGGNIGEENTEGNTAWVGDSGRKEICERLISSVDDLPGASKMSFISRLLIDKANSDWDKEGHEPLSYGRYHEYADTFVKQDRTRISLVRTPAAELQKMADDHRAYGVTINDLLMARMYQEDKTDKIIIAGDLRDRLPFYNKGALGNYATAFSVVVKRRDPDIRKIAQTVHKKVRRTISDPQALYLVLQCYASLKPEVLDAAFMAAKGAFDSKSAAFIGKMFFGFDEPRGYSITNLGKIESDSIISAFFIPPASPAIRKTVGVLTVNGEMICCVNER